MKFEKPSQTAKRLGVTPRAIQKWAIEGRIPYAHKVAGQWMIPVGFTAPSDKSEAVKPENTTSDMLRSAPKSLLNAGFEPGSCLSYIQSIEDESEREVAFAEYRYYSGDPEEAIIICEKYLECEDAYLRSTACLIYMYANMSCGHLHRAKFVLTLLQKNISERLNSSNPLTKIPEIHALLVWVLYATTTVFNSDSQNLEPIEDWIKYLPEGMKLFACYMIASRMRQKGKYEGAHSVARIAVHLSTENCVLSRIFCKLLDAIALMDMKMVDAAEKQFMLAWELAIKDGFIEPFAQHYILLQGLIERCIKPKYPNDYKNIIEKAKVFYGHVRAINEMESDGAELTVTEFSIAMLYTKDWSAKEIAAHFDMSVRTVYRHISNIYAALDISSVAELKKYMSN